METLSLGYSPCPNDTFIFYALAHRKISTNNICFREFLGDVETLNRMAGRSELDVTKVSYHAFGRLRDRYCLLRSGGAIGKACGPLVIAREAYDMEDLKGKTIAIPGRLTTAFLLLQLFDASFKDKIRAMPFDKIIDAVRNKEVEAGLIIHESRFTYQQAGLRKIIDLGEWWEKQTGLPIPLGGIIAKRGLGVELLKGIDGVIRKSAEYALSNREEPLPYIKRYSQEMEDKVIERHIDLYANNYSLDVGSDGIQAVKELFKRAEERGIIEKSSMPLMGYR